MGVQAVTTRSTRKLVSLSDSAIREDGSNFEEYQKTLDLAHLAYGDDATFFRCRALSKAERMELSQRLRAHLDDDQRYYWLCRLEAFAFGCMLVENLVWTEDGKEMALRRSGQRETMPGGFEQLAKEVRDRIPIETQLELGEYILVMTDMDDKQRGKS